MKADTKVEHLVADSCAFLNSVKFEKFTQNVYIPEKVISEVRNKNIREKLQVLPFEVHIRNPSLQTIKTVSEFAQKTGDYPSLSAVDIQVIALTYELHVERLGCDGLRTEPNMQRTVEQKPVDDNSKLPAGFYAAKKKSALSASATPRQSECTEDTASDCSSSSDEYEEDAEADWITPDNLAETLQQMGLDGAVDEEEDEVIQVACCTGDFAMQNVLLHYGLRVLSPENGLLIRNLRTYILRCYACFKTTSVMTRKFCAECGNATLKRVAVSSNAQDGSLRLHINFKRRINTRGTKYSLPAPQGGKHSSNPILCADQPMPQQRPSKRATAQVIDVFSPDYAVRESPFKVHDVHSRAARAGIRSFDVRQRTAGNPNAGRKTRKRGGRP